MATPVVVGVEAIATVLLARQFMRRARWGGAMSEDRFQGGDRSQRSFAILDLK
ncbi:hypothetical protein NEOLEDRAFT_1063045 [Neolentinus lepideus HHB14362 ss-1]|uniref:Uncharacterized protein n=1 Tax=Neolentinus lepideus HHB14362 ss-1 TaxID=1314782 RepID=A0A165TG60_9AGAM|nr:hypothetical protein NEOLEDRAFT_1063045 [Neolentinus lepideus HHB14362 ss-1]